MLVLKTTSPRASPGAPAATPRYQVPSSRASVAFMNVVRALRAELVARTLSRWCYSASGSTRDPSMSVTISRALLLDTPRDALTQLVSVHPNAGVSAAASSLRVDIRRFPWINRLAADYAFDAGASVAVFRRRRARRRTPGGRRSPGPRPIRGSATARRLLEAQQAGRGALRPPPRDATARLRDPRTVAIVTGQQAGLFGGPLFTVLKALTALRLAEVVRDTYDVPAVAVFWVDAEDHDWQEVNVCGVLDAEAALRTVAIEGEAAGPGLPDGARRAGSVDRGGAGRAGSRVAADGVHARRCSRSFMRATRRAAAWWTRSAAGSSRCSAARGWSSTSPPTPRQAARRRPVLQGAGERRRNRSVWPATPAGRSRRWAITPR